MLRASIDLGTNTCLLLVAEWDERLRIVTQVHGDFTHIVRLGEGVDRHRMLSTGAMERTLQCLKNYREKVLDFGMLPQDVICVATSQARDAQNGLEFFSKVFIETGFQFQTLSGDEEARLTFLGGLRPEMDPAKALVMDIGGGSTELVTSQGGASLDLGSVRFTERYLKSDPVTDDEFWKCEEAIDQALHPLKSWRHSILPEVILVGVAGTVTNLASIHLRLKKFDPQQINTLILTRGDVHRLVEDLKWRTVSERQLLAGIEAQRADVLLAGAMILWRVMEVLQFPTCHPSSRGLRFGVFHISS